MRVGKKLTKCQYLAIVLLIVLFGSSLYILPSLYAWNSANSDLQNPRTFHITFFFYFNGQSVTPEGTIPDITIDLTVFYPRGTLIVDDPVTISGMAVVNRTIPERVASLTVYFENAQAVPIEQDVNGITKGADLLLNPTQNSSLLLGETTMSWPVEGTYNPQFTITYTNGTGRYSTPLLVSTSVAITVYPKAQIAQIVNSNVSMILTIAIYALTLVGTGNLIVDLWDREPPSQKKCKYNPENVNSNTTKDSRR
jgi:hypothetical protein